MSAFLARLREPSTWAALTGLAALFGPHAGEYTAALQVAAAVAGAAGVLLPEGSKS